MAARGQKRTEVVRPELRATRHGRPRICLRDLQNRCGFGNSKVSGTPVQAAVLGALSGDGSATGSGAAAACTLATGTTWRKPASATSQFSSIVAARTLPVLR